MWLYKGKEFTTEDIGNYIGFVYLITNTNDGMKYVGKKVFYNRITKPPLKNQKKKRRLTVESNWKGYYGSNNKLNELVEENGTDGFKREILHLCESKGMLSYMELEEQMKRRVLFLPDEYLNGIIQVRISRVHLSPKSVDK